MPSKFGVYLVDGLDRAANAIVDRLPSPFCAPVAGPRIHSKLAPQPLPLGAEALTASEVVQTTRLAQLFVERQHALAILRPRPDINCCFVRLKSMARRRNVFDVRSARGRVAAIAQHKLVHMNRLSLAFDEPRQIVQTLPVSNAYPSTCKTRVSRTLPLEATAMSIRALGSS